jgi:flagellin
LRGQGASLSQAKRNAETAIGLVQVAEGGLSEQNNILVRLRELAVQSASDTVGEDERGYLNTEFDQLQREFDRIAETTTFGNKKLLSGANQEFVFHLGAGGGQEDAIRYTFDTDTRGDALGIADLSVKDKDASNRVLKTIDTALRAVAKARAGFGAIQSRLEIASTNLDVQHENIAAARSRIADADVAHEAAEMAQGQIQLEFATSVLAQANQIPQHALKLLA